MSWQVLFAINKELYLRNPDDSPLGRKIVSESIVLINEIGFEDFTFKKLAQRIETTEAGVYRYFENKHRLLQYLVSWYWRWMEYQVTFHTNNIVEPWRKIDIVIETLLLKKADKLKFDNGFSITDLHEMVVREAPKSFMTRNVTEDNKKLLFKPYKDLCRLIAEIFLEFNPKLKYPRTVASTLLEMAQQQYFFMNHLPSLTDFSQSEAGSEPEGYLKFFVKKCLI